MIADGSNGSIEANEDGIKIKRKGFANFLTQGIQGEKFLPYSSIRAVQFKEAGGWMAGFIQFSTVGSIDRPGGILEATKDENAVLFEKKQQGNFEAVRNLIEDKMRSRAKEGSPTVVSGNSDVDELERLASLLERGLLTRAEFDLKKSKILSR